MIIKYLKGMGCLVFLVILCGCQFGTSNGGLNGRVTLWHSWSAEEALILEEVLEQFQEIHPDVQIITTAFPYNQILTEFMVAGEEGLGPTLLLGTDNWISELADARDNPPYLSRVRGIRFVQSTQFGSDTLS